jgi:hypothetical protein
VSQMCVTMKPRRNEEAQAHIGLSSHRGGGDILVNLVSYLVGCVDLELDMAHFKSLNTINFLQHLLTSSINFLIVCEAHTATAFKRQFSIEPLAIYLIKYCCYIIHCDRHL